HLGGQVYHLLNPDLKHVPVDEQQVDGGTLEETAHLSELLKNTIDVRANYTIVQGSVAKGNFVFGVPETTDPTSQQPVIDPATGEQKTDPQTGELLWYAPNGPVGVGVNPRGLAGLDVGPGPRGRNVVDWGHGDGVGQRHDLTLSDLVDLAHDCDQGQFASAVQFDTGAKLDAHNLVPYVSLGAAHGLTLSYNSLRADPRPIVNFSFDDVNQVAPAVPGQTRLLAGRLT